MPTHHFFMTFPGRASPSGIDQRFDLGAIQVRAHDPHPFAIAPVKLPVLLIKLQLLGSEGAARRNNVGNIFPVKIRTLDGTVVSAGVAHVGPVKVTCLGVHDDAVRESPALAHNHLEIGAVRLGGKNFATART
jgi:hypothetical protein